MKLEINGETLIDNMLTSDELDKHTEWIVEHATKDPGPDVSHLKDVMEVADNQEEDIVERNEKRM